MRTASRLLLLTVAVAAACGGPTTDLREPRHPTPNAGLVQALAVWQHGAHAIPVAQRAPAPLALEHTWSTDDEPDAPFRDFDGDVREFLEHPRLADAIQFTCVPELVGVENWLTNALTAEDPWVRLRALVVLVRVRAPRSIDAQWRTLHELEADARASELAPLTDSIRAVFAPAAIARTLTGWPSPAPSYQWAIRAAGLIRHRPALARLTELARSPSIDVSLAAEKSLEDFDGTDADDALAACVLGWRYPASLAAARALGTRAPELLRSTLLSAAPPPDMLCYQGIYLARLDDPRAVPILCETVPSRAVHDREMFDAIERLAQRVHLAHVDALPARVRVEQRSRAEEVVASVRARLER